MLSLLIIFMLFGTLLPLVQKMQQTLYDKSLRLTAFETMYEAAKEIRATGADSGERTVNKVVFSWEYDSQLCVSYKTYRLLPETVCQK